MLVFNTIHRFALNRSQYYLQNTFKAVDVHVLVIWPLARTYRLQCHQAIETLDQMEGKFSWKLPEKEPTEIHLALRHRCSPCARRAGRFCNWTPIPSSRCREAVQPVYSWRTLQRYGRPTLHAQQHISVLMLYRGLHDVSLTPLQCLRVL